MARCSSQSTVLTSWVSQRPQMPPGKHINITNKASRTLGSGKNPEDRLLFSKRQGLQGSCHTSPGIYKLYLAPKQHQPDYPPRVCTAKGSMVDTTEMLLDIQCQHVNTRLTTSPTLVQESKTGEFCKFHHHHGSIATDTKWISGDYPSIARAHHSHSPLYPVPSCPASYRQREILLFPNAIEDWKDLNEDVAAAPTLRDFLSMSSKISIFRVGHAPK